MPYKPNIKLGFGSEDYINLPGYQGPGGLTMDGIWEGAPTMGGESMGLIKDSTFYEPLAIEQPPQTIHISHWWDAIAMAWRIWRGKSVYGKTPLVVMDCVFIGEPMPRIDIKNP